MLIPEYCAGLLHVLLEENNRKDSMPKKNTDISRKF